MINVSKEKLLKLAIISICILSFTCLALSVYFLFSIRESVAKCTQSEYYLVRYLTQRNKLVQIKEIYPIVMIVMSSLMSFSCLWCLYGTFTKKNHITVTFSAGIFICIVANILAAGLIHNRFAPAKSSWFESGSNIQNLLEKLGECCGYDNPLQTENVNCSYSLTCSERYYCGLVSINIRVTLAIILCNIALGMLYIYYVFLLPSNDKKTKTVLYDQF